MFQDGNPVEFTSVQGAWEGEADLWACKPRLQNSFPVLPVVKLAGLERVAITIIFDFTIRPYCIKTSKCHFKYDPSKCSSLSGTMWQAQGNRVIQSNCYDMP